MYRPHNPSDYQHWKQRAVIQNTSRNTDVAKITTNEDIPSDKSNNSCSKCAQTTNIKSKKLVKSACKTTDSAIKLKSTDSDAVKLKSTGHSTGLKDREPLAELKGKWAVTDGRWEVVWSMRR